MHSHRLLAFVGACVAALSACGSDVPESGPLPSGTDAIISPADVPWAAAEAQAIAEARTWVTLPPEGSFPVVEANRIEDVFEKHLSPNQPVRARLPGMGDWPEVCLPLIEHRSATVTEADLKQIREVTELEDHRDERRTDIDSRNPDESIPSTTVPRRPVVNETMKAAAERVVTAELEAEACGTRMKDYEKELAGTPTHIDEPDDQTPTSTTTIAP